MGAAICLFCGISFNLVNKTSLTIFKFKKGGFDCGLIKKR